MKHIIITGRPGCGHVERARQRYTEQMGKGRHVLLDAPGDLRNSRPECSMTAAQVLITARDADQPLSEATYE